MTGESDVRRLATGLPGVSERTCYGLPGFYVARKIFARIHEMPGVVVLWLADPGARQTLLDADPEKFFTTEHYAGHMSVLARLDRLDTDELGELLTEAWFARAPKRLRDRAERDTRPSGRSL